MNISTTILFLIITFSALLGYIMGIVQSRMAANRSKKSEQMTAPTPEPEPQPIPDELLPTAVAPSAPIPQPAPLDEQAVLRVTQDNEQKWRVELDKVRLDDPSAISAEQRQRLINLIVQLRPWLDGKPIPANTPTPTPVAPAQATPPAYTPSPVTPAPPKVTPPLAPKAAPVANPPALKVDALRGLRSLLQNDIKIPGEEKKSSIVTMIDEVLQAKLLGSAFATQKICLEEGPSGEVIVVVGKNKYQGVDEVPDPEVRALIKSAINDWEKK